MAAGVALANTPLPDPDGPAPERDSLPPVAPFWIIYIGNAQLPH